MALVNAGLASGITVGLDIGDKQSHICVVDSNGEILEEGVVRTTPEALRQRFGGDPCRVALEASTHSPWIARLLDELKHQVIVANPHALRLIAQSGRKNDRNDAQLLAYFGRIDPARLGPIRHRGLQAQADLALIRSRDALVRSRTLLINCVRGTLKAFGVRVPAGTGHAFHRRATDCVPPELALAIMPLLTSIETLDHQIAEMERSVERIAEERYPQTRALRQIAGVGPLTALTFVLVVEDPHRFAKSRDIGAYLGLTPGQRQSGERSPQMSITKAGDHLLRRLLIQAAHYVMGPFGPPSDLRAWGQLKAPAGNPALKKRALVAVARKLAVLMHHLWVTGEVYEAVRQPAVA